MQLTSALSYCTDLDNAECQKEAHTYLDTCHIKPLRWQEGRLKEIAFAPPYSKQHKESDIQTFEHDYPKRKEIEQMKSP